MFTGFGGSATTAPPAVQTVNPFQIRPPAVTATKTPAAKPPQPQTQTTNGVFGEPTLTGANIFSQPPATGFGTTSTGQPVGMFSVTNQPNPFSHSIDYQHVITLLSQSILHDHPAMVYLRETPRRELTESVRNQLQPYLGSAGGNIEMSHMLAIIHIFQAVLNSTAKSEEQIKLLQLDERIRIHVGHFDVRETFLGLLIICFSRAPFWFQQSTNIPTPARSTDWFSGIGPEDNFMRTVFGPLLRGALINLKEHPFRRSCPPPSSSSNSNSSFITLSTSSSASSLSSSQVHPKITSFILPLLMFTLNRPPLSHLLIPSIIQLIRAIYSDTDSSHTLTTMTSLPTSVSSIPSASSPSSSTSTTTPSTSIPIDDAQFALIRLFQQNPDFNSEVLPLIRLLRQAGATTKFTTNILAADTSSSIQFSSWGVIQKVDTRQVNSWVYLSSWMSRQKLECILQWLNEEFESNPTNIMQLYDPTFELDVGDGSGSQTTLAYVQRLIVLHPNNTPLQIYRQLIHRLHQFTSQHGGSSTTLSTTSSVVCKNEAELDEEMAINLDALRTLNVASSSASCGGPKKTNDEGGATVTKVSESGTSLTSTSSTRDELGEGLRKMLTQLSIRCYSAQLLERLIQVKSMDGSSSQANGVNFANPSHRNQFSSSQLEAIHSIMTDVVHLLSDSNRPERLNLAETDAYGNSLFHSLLSIPTHELIRLRPYQHILFQLIEQQVPKQSLVANKAILEKFNRASDFSFSFIPSTANVLKTPSVAPASSSSRDYYPFSMSQKLPSPQWTVGSAFTIGRRFHLQDSEPNVTSRYQLIGIQYYQPDGATITPNISIYDNSDNVLLQISGSGVQGSGVKGSGVCTQLFTPIDFHWMQSQPNFLICLSWGESQIQLDRDEVPPTQLIEQRLVRTPLNEPLFEHGFDLFPTKNLPHPTGFNCAPIVRKTPIVLSTSMHQVPVPSDSLLRNQSQIFGGAAASSTPPLSFSFGPPSTSSGSTPSFGATASSPAIFGTPAKIESTSFLSLFTNPLKPSADVVPVDSECPHASTMHVHTEDGTDFDCALRQPNIGNNNNKFYKIQLLATNSSPRNYGVWKRWGREGERGQSQMSSYASDLTAAKHDFFTKFKDKTKNDWSNRHKFKQEPGKYSYEPRRDPSHAALTASPPTSSLVGATTTSSIDTSTPSFGFNLASSPAFNFKPVQHLTTERLFGDALPTAEIHTINRPQGLSYAVGNGATLPLDLLFAYHSPYPANQFIWSIYDLIFTLTLDHLRVTYPKISVDMIMKENLIGHLSAIIGRWSELVNSAELKVWIDLFQSHSIPIANPSVSFGITPLNDIFELWLRGGDNNIHLIRGWLSTCHDSTDGLWPTRAPKLQHESLLETVTRLSNGGNLGDRAVGVFDLLQTETDRWYHIYGPLIKMDVEDFLIPDLTTIIYEYLLPPTNDAASTFASSFLSRSLLSVANHSSFTPAR